MNVRLNVEMLLYLESLTLGEKKAAVANPWERGIFNINRNIGRI